jgi:Flp pilus assembly pilin Flp
MKLIKNEDGATAIEYAVMAAAIAGAIALTVFAVGVKVYDLYINIRKLSLIITKGKANINGHETDKK